VIGWPPSLPPEYDQREVEGVGLVGLAPLLPSLIAALRRDSLYGYASRHPARKPLQGRGRAYAVPLPSGEKVVVRHNRHGGTLARVTRDLFLHPTRAPHELRTSIRLRESGVPTPEIVGFAIYPAGMLMPLMRRSDVVSREIEGKDLAELLGTETDPALRRRALRATGQLLQKLASAGARHPDLNLKNVLLSADGSGLHASVLDVDRVVFTSGGVSEANVARIVRSAEKWQSLGAPITDEEIQLLAGFAGNE
jgi:hypothetical protein